MLLVGIFGVVPTGADVGVTIVDAAAIVAVAEVLFLSLILSLNLC